jgi:hypothetical protein
MNADEATEMLMHSGAEGTVEMALEKDTLPRRTRAREGLVSWYQLYDFSALTNANSIQPILHY